MATNGLSLIISQKENRTCLRLNERGVTTQNSPLREETEANYQVSIIFLIRNKLCVVQILSIENSKAWTNEFLESFELTSVKGEA